MAFAKSAKGLKAFRRLIAPIHPAFKFTSWPKEFQDLFLKHFNKFTHEIAAFTEVHRQVLTHQGGAAVSAEKLSQLCVLLMGCIAFVSASSDMEV